MTGFIHASVGGFLAKVLPLPLALPAAVISHFALDALPHYGLPHHKRDGRFWRIFTIADFILSWGYLGVIAVVRHHYAVAICALAAASPDFIWVARVVRTGSFNFGDGHKGKFARWHAAIQRYERPWGIYVEMPVAATLAILVFKYW